MVMWAQVTHPALVASFMVNTATITYILCSDIIPSWVVMGCAPFHHCLDPLVVRLKRIVRIFVICSLRNIHYLFNIC